MWAREMERANSGVIREVPNLQEKYIVRDSWTKLNVSPAKIMQVHSLLNLLLACVIICHRFALLTIEGQSNS